MRVRSNDFRVHERRSLSLARILDRLPHYVVAGNQVGPVDLLDEEIRESAYQLRDRSTGGVDFHRHRDGVAVVLDEKDDGEPEIARRVEALPELPFARLPFTRRAEHDFILMESLGDSEQLCTEGRLGGANAL